MLDEFNQVLDKLLSKFDNIELTHSKSMNSNCMVEPSGEI